MSSGSPDLRFLTVNVGAAAPARARTMLEWLLGRADDVLVLTETSSGDGTRELLDGLRGAGYEVVGSAEPRRDRGCMLASRVPVRAVLTDELASVLPPGRAVGMRLDQVAVIGIYVPSRDRSPAKTERKRMFLDTLATALGRLPTEHARSLVLGGDYNVIGAGHEPRHRGFFPFEFQFFDRIAEHGLHDPWAGGAQEHSWIGRTGNGYRYDYFHVAEPLRGAVVGGEYLHETRHARTTDHAAVSLVLGQGATASRTSES